MNTTCHTRRHPTTLHPAENGDLNRTACSSRTLEHKEREGANPHKISGIGSETPHSTVPPIHRFYHLTPLGLPHSAFGMVSTSIDDWFGEP